MTKPFKIPPRLVGGHLEVGGTRLTPDDFEWKDVDIADPYMVNEEGIRTTSVGYAKLDSGSVRLVVGYYQKDEMPCFSITCRAEPGHDLGACSFDFEEVQS
ncbi:hypothetical protein [Roseovarius indicus]|uniref:hypothetical protein n=1 Tax=Roseovarius indicus TaxID=540747 RepID=UPI0032EBFE27